MEREEREPLKFQARELINCEDRSHEEALWDIFLPWMTSHLLKYELQKLEDDIYGEKVTTLGLEFISWEALKGIP